MNSGLSPSLDFSADLRVVGPLTVGLLFVPKTILSLLSELAKFRFKFTVEVTFGLNFPGSGDLNKDCYNGNEIENLEFDFMLKSW